MSSPLLWTLSSYNFLTECLENFTFFTRKVYKAVQSVFIPENYIFFRGIDMPYLDSKVNIKYSRSATPVWSYNPDTNAFKAWGTTGSFPHSLPILSLEILEGQQVIHDLTDFIERVRVFNSMNSPDVKHLVHAWILSSELVLDYERGLKIRYINDQADTLLVPLNGVIFLDQYTDEEFKESS